MNLIPRNGPFRPVLILLICSFYTHTLTAQNSIRGRILYEKDSRPASAVSVSFANYHSGNVTDHLGNFDIPIPAGGRRDTLVISSVGYQSIRIPVKQALAKKEFLLTEVSKTLQTVVIRSFNNEQVIGDKFENAAYFRSWNTDSTGGEIGRIFPISHDEYKVNKVRFKANNGCDTCTIRLRIRKVVNGYPAGELVTDSIGMTLKKITMDGKTPEFDLTQRNIILKEKEVFVGLEVVGCTRPANSCSFSFVGTEKGTYTYKSEKYSYWSNTDEEGFKVHLKIYVGY